MDTILTWVNEMWWLLLLAAVVVMKVLNLITAHWSERRGLVRWCLFIVDVLDVLKSTPPPARKP